MLEIDYFLCLNQAVTRTFFFPVITLYFHWLLVCLCILYIFILSCIQIKLFYTLFITLGYKSLFKTTFCSKHYQPTTPQNLRFKKMYRNKDDLTEKHLMKSKHVKCEVTSYHLQFFSFASQPFFFLFYLFNFFLPFCCLQRFIQPLGYKRYICLDGNQIHMTCLNL